VRDNYTWSKTDFSEPIVSGGLGHGGRQHVANEYMTVEGLRDFEKFVATFLYSMADREPPGDPFHQKTDA
jgi:acetylornithine deacetylase/succinyl-diaminopimelate desuccinylase-like protein